MINKSVFISGLVKWLFSNFKTWEEKQAHPSPDGEFKDEFLVYIPGYMAKVEPRLRTTAPNSQIPAPSLFQSHRQPNLRLLQRFSSEMSHLGNFRGAPFDGFLKVRERVIPAEDEIPLRHT